MSRQESYHKCPIKDVDVPVLTLAMFQVREVDSGRVMYSESDSMDVPMVTTACDGQLLVAFYDGSHLVKVLIVS